MKKLNLLVSAILLTLISTISYAQPSSFNYQAVLRDANGSIIANQTVTMEFAIRSGSAGGSIQYNEEQVLTTNEFGLVNHAVGTGNTISGNFDNITWDLSPKFLRVRLDNGGGPVTLGTQQLLSVPYAIHAETAETLLGGIPSSGWNSSGNNISNTNSGNVGVGTSNPIQKLDVNGRMNVNNGVIQRGGSAITATSDLGLYSRVAGNFMRFVTNNAPFNFYTEEGSSGIGDSPRMTIASNGNVGIGTTSPGSRLTAINASNAGASPAVRGETNGTGGGTQTNAPTGVLGIVNSTNAGSWSAGVRGINNSNQFTGVGVLGYTFGTGSGIVGIGGRSMEGDGTFINFGDGSFTGLLSKGGGSFKIDHPLDPENKYLYHSFVESPDMMNIYNGNVHTDTEGRAEVSLPDYFEPLNRDFRYQLTVIGSFSQVMIEQKIDNGLFVIRSSEPNVEVSWQVTGIRQDKFANANRIEVEVEKPVDEKGRYFHPEVYGKSKDLQAPIPSGPISENLNRPKATANSGSQNENASSTSQEAPTNQMKSPKH